jgi:hypothetical protein
VQKQSHKSIAAANRRSALRRTPKGSAKVHCYAGKYGLGPNVAVGLLDVSEYGVRLIVKTAAKPGREIEIGLETVRGQRPTVVKAEVAWCVELADGNFCLGARFDKPLDWVLLQAVGKL